MLSWIRPVVHTGACVAFCLRRMPAYAPVCFLRCVLFFFGAFPILVLTGVCRTGIRAVSKRAKPCRNFLSASLRFCVTVYRSAYGRRNRLLAGGAMPIFSGALLRVCAAMCPVVLRFRNHLPRGEYMPSFCWCFAPSLCHCVSGGTQASGSSSERGSQAEFFGALPFSINVCRWRSCVGIFFKTGEDKQNFSVPRSILPQMLVCGAQALVRPIQAKLC